MSVSYFVRYEGHAESPEAFLLHYRYHHAPILARLPGIERVILHTPVPWQDPFPVKPHRSSLLAQMVFASQEVLDKALHSEARAVARDDFGSFPPFHGSVLHQATESEEVFSR